MGQDRPTLLDVAKAQDPNGAPAMVIEVLEQYAPMLQDGPAYPSNAQLGERTTLRSSLPAVNWAQLNKGTTRSKGSYQQRNDTIAFLDALSEVDVRLQLAIGQSAVNAYRKQEDDGFLEALAQLVATTCIYGDENVNPQAFTGFAPRLSTVASAKTGSQVHDMAESVAVSGGDGTSMYVVDWGRRGAHFIYPRDGEGTGGVQTRDLGEQIVTDADGLSMTAYVTKYNWMIGLAVKDPRHIARLANIDISDANLGGDATQGQLTNSLIDIMNLMPKPAGMQRVIYTHNQIVAAFHKQALAKANLALSIQDYLGELIPHFYGYPVRAMDAITSGESTVS